MLPQLEILRAAAVTSAMYVAYTAYNCPCDPLFACHIGKVTAATTFLFGMSVYVLMYLRR